MRELSEDLCRTARQLVTHHEVGTVQLQAGDEGRTVSKTICGWAPNAAADPLPIAFLVSRCERYRR